MADTVTEFRSSLPKALWASGGCAAVGGVIAYAALIAPAAWAWFVVAYFGIIAAALCWGGLVRPATLRLDADGVRYAQGRHAWFVAWTDLAEVEVMVLRTNWVFKTQLWVILRDNSGVKRNIPSGLTIAPAHLAQLIRSRWALAAEVSAA